MPVFVKPANSGSSVGITKARDEDELAASLREATRYDDKIIAERALDAREIEVAVLGNEAPEASVPGEIVPHHEFYDYEAKYHDETTELVIPAPLSDEESARLRALAIEAYRALDAEGMARVDFLVERADGTAWINELNSLPGFTDGSMYPRLWEASGLPYSALLDRLIELALERHRRRSRLETRYRRSGA
jgi:D-alanine-D-alanine ligase